MWSIFGVKLNYIVIFEKLCNSSTLEAGRVQIRRKGLNARFLIRNKAQSPGILDQVAQFISHWKTVSDGSAIDRSVIIGAIHDLWP